jgi:hypothetical protein
LIENDETDLLSNGWTYDVHGEHCLFLNTLTQQKIEVSLGNDEMLTDLDPYFFYSFLKSTPTYHSLSELFSTNPFKQMCQLFDYLVSENYMQNVNSTAYRKIG